MRNLCNVHVDIENTVDCCVILYSKLLSEISLKSRFKKYRLWYFEKEITLS